MKKDGYRRRRGRTAKFIAVLILAAGFTFLYFYVRNIFWIVVSCIAALLVLTITVFILLKIRRKRKLKEAEKNDSENDQNEIAGEREKPHYVVKNCLMTKTELRYFDAIREAVGDEYVVVPQVPLSGVIEKEGDFEYQGELFRTIDFGIFSLDYVPLLLIEINDGTHRQEDRKERDEKVKEICKEAGIQIIAFWVNQGIDQGYIKKRIYECIYTAW